MFRQVLVTVLAAVLLATAAAGAYAQDKQELKTFMRAKLSHSQKVLEGLVEQDFVKIDKNAQEMSLLSLAATWQVLTTPEYVELSRKFRNETDKLVMAAKGKDLNDALKAFQGVTTQCVDCHKYLRDVKFVSLER